MSKLFKYANRDFTLENKIEGGKLLRTVINDGGLEFPFPNYEKASEFLADEYGGSKDEAVKVLVATESLDGVEVSGTPAAVNPEKGVKKGGAGKKKEKAEKTPKEKKEKAEKAPKEVVEKTFELAGKAVTKKLQVKTILPNQQPESTEDVDLDMIYHLHIDIYSKKNRTSTLTKKAVAATPEAEGSAEEVIIGGVSLMDVIYAYAEKVGMSFPQADKYIKIKRGLLPEPEKKAPKAPKADKTTKADATDATAETATSAEASTPAENGEAEA